MENLASRTARALGWNLLGTGGRIGSQLVIQIWLARLLEPAEFGLMAMIMVVTSVSLVFVEGGFGVPLIQNKDATVAEESSVFFLNVGLAGAVYAILWIAAPFVADFYGHQVLTGLLRLSSLGMIFSAFGVIQNSVLARRLEFKVQSAATVGAAILSGAVAIWMALRGWGVWSLAWQFILSSAIRTAYLWFASPWRPVCAFRPAAVRRMGIQGSRMVLSNIVARLFESLNQLLIGRFYTAADLGFYSRAKTMQSIPVNTFSQSVGSVLLPAFVHLKDDRGKFCDGYRNAILMSAAVSIPMMVVLAFFAEPLFGLALGDKWLPAVPYFQLFCISGAIYPLQLLNINVLLAMGHTGVYLKVELIKKFIALTGALTAVSFGVYALAISAVIVSGLSLAVNVRYANNYISYGFRRQAADIAPFAGAAVLAGSSALVGVSRVDVGVIPALGLGCVIFAVIYVGLLSLWGREALRPALRLISKKIKKS